MASQKSSRATFAKGVATGIGIVLLGEAALFVASLASRIATIERFLASLVISG